MDLDARRRVFAEEIQVRCNIRHTAVVDALATVPREQFLRAGPWTIRGESDVMKFAAWSINAARQPCLTGTSLGTP